VATGPFAWQRMRILAEKAISKVFMVVEEIVRKCYPAGQHAS